MQKNEILAVKDEELPDSRVARVEMKPMALAHIVGVGIVRESGHSPYMLGFVGALGHQACFQHCIEERHIPFEAEK